MCEQGAYPSARPVGRVESRQLGVSPKAAAREVERVEVVAQERERRLERICAGDETHTDAQRLKVRGGKSALQGQRGHEPLDCAWGFALETCGGAAGAGAHREVPEFDEPESVEPARDDVVGDGTGTATDPELDESPVVLAPAFTVCAASCFWAAWSAAAVYVE